MLDRCDLHVSRRWSESFLITTSHGCRGICLSTILWHCLHSNAIHHLLYSFSFVEVLLLDCECFLSLKGLQLGSNRFYSLDLSAQRFCLIVVFGLDSQSFIHLELSQLVLSVCIIKGIVHSLWRVSHRGAGLIHNLLSTFDKRLLTTRAHVAHSCLVHHGNWWRENAIGGSDAVECDKTDLVLYIKLVLMVRMEDHLE